MEKITHEQMLAEFGDTGVENPAVVDLITTAPASETVVLVMIERRRWGAAVQQFKQIEEKLNRYMAYALDGFLGQHYPPYDGRPVQIRLDCVEPPHGDAEKFVQAMAAAIERHGMTFALNVQAPADRITAVKTTG